MAGCREQGVKNIKKGRGAGSKELGEKQLMTQFRFQNMDIWRESIEIGNVLFDIADELETRRLFRFAEQLRGAGMSMSNNIAEGSGSNSRIEFKNYLNIARRSTFENANILFILNQRSIIDNSTRDSVLKRLEILCRKITKFQKSLT